MQTIKKLILKAIQKISSYLQKLTKQLTFLLCYLYHFIKGNRYKIKRGYIERKQYIYFDDTPLQDEYQNEVYQEALRLAKLHNLTTIIDYGCGSGYKLMKYFAEYATTGIDVEPTVAFLKQKYPNRHWLEEQFFQINPPKADLVICADVIEHVTRPEQLIKVLKAIPQVQYFVFSTVDRDIIRGKNDWGPPKNRYHLREWNSQEFQKYLSLHFEILEHKITNYLQGTQMIICKPLSKPSD